MRKGEIFHVSTGTIIVHMAEMYDSGESLWLWGMSPSRENSVNFLVTGKNSDDRFMFIRSFWVATSKPGTHRKGLGFSKQLEELWEVFHFKTRQKLFVRSLFRMFKNVRP